ncbi:MAG: hypothetical protein IH587_01115 [Anaerolineae bacterium]|nr:hypothetical protein [Anaerolineae bacterium]
MDMDTFLTKLYVFIDDWYKAKAAPMVKRTVGPEARLSDSEVLTLAIVSQWRCGVPWQSERAMVRYMQKEGRQWFPQMLSRSRYNERVRCLWAVLVILQQALAELLGSREALYEVVDCVPLPNCSNAQACKKGHWLYWSTRGYGGTRVSCYWGDQALISVTPEYAITGWLIGPANADDRVLLQGLISQRNGQCIFTTPTPWRPHRQIEAPAFLHPVLAAGRAATGATYLADKGFNGFRWQNHWYTHYGVSVVTEPPRNLMPADWPVCWSRSLHHMRQVIETTFAILTTAFRVQHLMAHSLWGQLTRFAATLAAFNWGLFINRQLGRHLLSHATLLN